MPPKGVVPPHLQKYLWTSETAPRFYPSPPKFKEWNKLVDSILTQGGVIGVGRVGKLGSGFLNTVIAVNPAEYYLAVNKVQRLKNIPNSHEMYESLENVGDYLRTVVIPRMFDDESSAETGMWEQLKDTTQKWRFYKGYADGPILQASGALYQAATSDKAIVDIKTGTNARVVLGGQHFASPEMEKYFVHMAGSYSRLYHAQIPKRPFMPQSEDDLTQHDKENITEIFRGNLASLVEDD